MKRNLTILIWLFILIAAFWMLAENQSSYTQPVVAIFELSRDLLTVEGYNSDGKALLFVFNEHRDVGAAYFREGPFGWKKGEMSWLSLGPIDSKRLHGFGGIGDELLFGLIKDADQETIIVNGQEAEIMELNTFSLSQMDKYKLEGISIWYYEGQREENETIKLIDRTTGETIDEMGVGN